MVPIPTPQDMARVAGNILGIVGVLLYVLGMCSLAGEPGQGVAWGTRTLDPFRFSGIFVTTAWLLLRLAAGQFPFGGLRRSPAGENTTRVRFLGILLAATALFCTLGMASFRTIWYANADPIERVEMDTHRHLVEYERSGDPARLREWVLWQDGAFSTAALYTLGDWAPQHPDQFMAFLSSFDYKEGARFARNFGAVLADTNRETPFRAAFEGYRSRRLSLILRERPEATP